MSKFDGSSRSAARGWDRKALDAQVWDFQQQRGTAGTQGGGDGKRKEGGQQSRRDDATASG